MVHLQFIGPKSGSTSPALRNPDVPRNRLDTLKVLKCSSLWMQSPGNITMITVLHGKNGSLCSKVHLRVRNGFLWFRFSGFLCAKVFGFELVLSGLFEFHEEQFSIFGYPAAPRSFVEVCYDPSGLIALRVTLPHPCAALCQNQYPHITVAKVWWRAGGGS